MRNPRGFSWVFGVVTAGILLSGFARIEDAVPGRVRSVRESVPGLSELDVGATAMAGPSGKNLLFAPPERRSRNIISVQLEPGSGQLENGRAQIELRQDFALSVKGCELTAHVCPRDAKARGYLYVEKLLPDRMVVVESGGGKSDACFDYVVIATQWSSEKR